MLIKTQIFSYAFILALTSIHAIENEVRLITHHTPTPLSPEAITSKWPRFNGPFDNAISPETFLIKDWKNKKPQIIWEVSKGEGYSSPAVAKGILVLFHRKDGSEIIEGLDSETGNLIWSYRYEVDYRDRYGYSNGPRASPVIEGDLVYAHGVTSWLTCLNLKTGKLVWQRDLKSEFQIPDYFFGKGSNPIIFKNKLILNVGGSKNRCVVAFDTLNGKTIWICKDPWGASYSSPSITSIQGKIVCLVVTGGESRPPTGGLLVIDPNNGEKLSRFSWRSSNYESANAVPPIPCGNDQVFLSECYEKGGVLLKFDHAFNPNVVWHNPKINIHWMTPIIEKGMMFGIAGRHQQGAEVFALKLSNGEIYWKDRIMWTHELSRRTIKLGLFRGSLLKIKNGYFALSELGTLLSLDLSENGWSIKGKSQLFFAPGTWTLPALSNGLLYVMQNEIDRNSGKKPRIICLDLRTN